MIRRFRYPPRRLVGDYLRAGLGLAGSLLFWLFLPPSPAGHMVFGGLTLLFLLFTIRTLWRQAIRIELADDMISMAPPRRGPLAWRDIVRIDLRYYSTRRNRGDGWVALTLRSPQARIAVDSELDGFEAILARAAAAARAGEIAMNAATRANFRALGHEPGGEAEP